MTTESLGKDEQLRQVFDHADHLHVQAIQIFEEIPKTEPDLMRMAGSLVNQTKELKTATWARYKESLREQVK